MTKHAPSCPYCKSHDACEHTLLIVDLHWQSTEGGALTKSFHQKLENADIEGTEDFDEIVFFRDLVTEVSELSDAECEFVNEGGPGNTTVGRAFYIEDPKTFSSIKKRFNK